MPITRTLVITCLSLGALIAGCGKTVTQQSVPPTTQQLTGLSSLTPDTNVHARVAPPAGWKAEPLKESDKHTHQVWISPSGRTAYGVISFSLPWPVSAEFLLPFYLKQMEKSEGEAILLERLDDPNLPGVRFVAEGGMYTNLITRGWRGWAIYAGTLRKEPIMPDELELAERARETTRIGLK
jgi:hypothetical protein